MTTRTLTDHKVNGLNDALDIHVLDQPGPGGANHDYVILGFNTDELRDRFIQRCKESDTDVLEPHRSVLDRALDSLVEPFCRVRLQFQNGPIGSPADLNGVSGEALLAVVIDRMRGFQAGQYACRENALALTHLEEALMWLQKRTRDRMARGVEGTMKK